MQKKRVSIATVPLTHLDLNLIDSHIKSYDWLLSDGVKELFDEINPVMDYTGEIL